jgi:hypothetical protein
MIRPCHRCRLNTEQYKVVEGQVLKWICRKCRSIAWVSLVKTPPEERVDNVKAQ